MPSLALGGPLLLRKGSLGPVFLIVSLPLWCPSNAARPPAARPCVACCGLPSRRVEALEGDLQGAQEGAKAAERAHLAEQAQAQGVLESVRRERDERQAALEDERRALQETRAALQEAKQRIEEQAGWASLPPSPSGPPLPSFSPGSLLGAGAAAGPGMGSRPLQASLPDSLCSFRPCLPCAGRPSLCEGS